MEKDIYIVLSGYPFGTNRFSEKLRMSLGLTLNDDNNVNLVFTGDSRYALTGLDEASSGINPIQKNIDMMAEMGASLHIEEGEGFKYPETLNAGLFKTEDLDGLLEKADVIIT